MDFFQISSNSLSTLTRNERVLFDFVVKNMDAIKNKGIREVSAECFVSTTTFLRFVKKLGFSGYREFTTVIKFTLFNKTTEQETSPFVVKQIDYREEYLKNIIESVRVLEPSKMEAIALRLSKRPNIFIFAKGLSKCVAQYVKYIYMMKGFFVEFPEDHQYRQAVAQHINKDDLVIVLTYGGHDIELIQLVQQLKSGKKSPYLISVTGADNNVIQNLSDTNLYIFTDEIEMNKRDITSRISTIAILELVLYQYIENSQEYKEQVTEKIQSID